jgi:hypothetical protein
MEDIVKHQLILVTTLVLANMVMPSAYSEKISPKQKQNILNACMATGNLCLSTCESLASGVQDCRDKCDAAASACIHSVDSARQIRDGDKTGKRTSRPKQ